MKLIVGIIKPFKLDDVKDALKDLGVHGITVSGRAGLRPSARPHRGVPRCGVHDRLRAEGAHRGARRRRRHRTCHPGTRSRPPARARSVTARSGSCRWSRSTGSAPAKPARTRSERRVARADPTERDLTWTRRRACATERERVVADTRLRGAAFGAALADVCDAVLVETAGDAHAEGQVGRHRRRVLRPARAVPRVRPRRRPRARGRRPGRGRPSRRPARCGTRSGTPGSRSARRPGPRRRRSPSPTSELDALTALLDYPGASPATTTSRSTCATRRAPSPAKRRDARDRRARVGGERPLRPSRARGRDGRAQREGGRRRTARLPCARVGGLGGVAAGRARPVSSRRASLAPDDVDELEARERPHPRRAGRAAPGDRRALRPAHAPGAGRGRPAPRESPTPTRCCASSPTPRARSGGSAARCGRASSREARGPSSRRTAHRDQPIAQGVVLRDGRVTLLADEPVTMTATLRVAAAAAERDAADRPRHARPTRRGRR